MVKKGTMNLLVMLAQLVNIILNDEIQLFLISTIKQKAVTLLQIHKFHHSINNFYHATSIACCKTK